MFVFFIVRKVRDERDNLQTLQIEFKEGFEKLFLANEMAENYIVTSCVWVIKHSEVLKFKVPYLLKEERKLRLSAFASNIVIFLT